MKSLVVAFFLTICLFLMTSCQKSGKPDFEIVSQWEKDQSFIFSVFTEVTDQNRIQEYAETLPYVDGKNTTAYFFCDRSLAPDISDWQAQSWVQFVLRMWKSDHFKNCGFLYDRFGSGSERLVKNPSLHLKDKLF